MKIYIGSDHAGLAEKEALMKFIGASYPQSEIIDVGTHTKESCHYPEYAIELCKRIIRGGVDSDRGILICGSGIGMSMVANRFSGIRAALCHSENEAKLSREHNDANVLCLGARITPVPEMEKILKVWMATPGPEKGSRHAQRIKMMSNIGEKL